MEFIITAHDMLLMHGCAFMEIYRMVIHRNWLMEPAREIKMKMTNIYRLLVRQVLKQKCLYAIMNPLCVIINRLIICLCQSLLVNCLFDMHWACIDYWKKKKRVGSPQVGKLETFLGIMFSICFPYEILMTLLLMMIKLFEIIRFRHDCKPSK